MINSVLSWGGCALLLLGLKLVGDKKLMGFYIAGLAESLWIVWGIRTNAFALVAMSVVILGMYCRAIWLWQKAEPMVSNSETSGEKR